MNLYNISVNTSYKYLQCNNQIICEAKCFCVISKKLFIFVFAFVNEIIMHYIAKFSNFLKYFCIFIQQNRLNETNIIN